MEGEEGEGKRQSYGKPGFIGYEGKISWRCSAADRRLFRSSLARYRERRLLAGGLSRIVYTLSPRIMVVKRFTSSIFVARNATLIVNLRGIVAKSSDAVLSYLGGSFPKRSVPRFRVLSPFMRSLRPILDAARFPACPRVPPYACMKYNHGVTRQRLYFHTVQKSSLPMYRISFLSHDSEIARRRWRFSLLVAEWKDSRKWIRSSFPRSPYLPIDASVVLTLTVVHRRGSSWEILLSSKKRDSRREKFSIRVHAIDAYN